MGLTGYDLHETFLVDYVLNGQSQVASPNTPFNFQADMGSQIKFTWVNAAGVGPGYFTCIWDNYGYGQQNICVLTIQVVAGVQKVVAFFNVATTTTTQSTAPACLYVVPLVLQPSNEVYNVGDEIVLFWTTGGTPVSANGVLTLSGPSGVYTFNLDQNAIAAGSYDVGQAQQKDIGFWSAELVIPGPPGCPPVGHASTSFQVGQPPSTQTLPITTTTTTSYSSQTSTSTTTIIPPLQVTLVANKESGQAPLHVEFGSTVSGGVPPYTYYWNWGDGYGDVTTTHYDEHTYMPGTWTVTLTVKDATGQTATSNSIRITVTPQPLPIPGCPNSNDLTPIDITPAKEDHPTEVGQVGWPLGPSSLCVAFKVEAGVFGGPADLVITDDQWPWGGSITVEIYDKDTGVQYTSGSGFAGWMPFSMYPSYVRVHNLRYGGVQIMKVDHAYPSIHLVMWPEGPTGTTSDTVSGILAKLFLLGAPFMSFPISTDTSIKLSNNSIIYCSKSKFT